MADITGTKVKRNEFCEVEFADAAAAATIEMGADDRMALLIRNEGAEEKTITIKAGNALQAGGDLTVSVQPSGCGVLHLESGKYAQVSGENAGCLCIEAEDGIHVACVILP